MAPGVLERHASADGSSPGPARAPATGLGLTALRACGGACAAREAAGRAGRRMPIHEKFPRQATTTSPPSPEPCVRPIPGTHG